MYSCSTATYWNAVLPPLNCFCSFVKNQEIESLVSRRNGHALGPYSQSYGFSSSHVGCDSWATKKAEHRRIDAFELWCWRRLLRVPWTARRSNQSVLKEINSEYLSDRLMLKLKLQYFGHLIQRANSSEKTLMLWKIEGRRRREWQRMWWLDGLTDSMDMNLSKLQEIVKDRGAWCSVVHEVTKKDMT